MTLTEHASRLMVVGDNVFSGRSELICVAGGWRASGRQLTAYCARLDLTVEP